MIDDKRFIKQLLEKQLRNRNNKQIHNYYDRNKLIRELLQYLEKL